MSDSRYHTAEEAAALLHCSVRHLLDRARKGDYPGSKPGRKWIFSDDDIATILEVSRVKPTPKRSALTARQRRASA